MLFIAAIRRRRSCLLPVDPYLWILIAAVLLSVWIFSGMAFDQHLGLRTHRRDLGNIDMAIWNSSRGYFLQAVRENVMSTRLTDHVEPIFVLISPIFWVWNDVRALLLLQTAAVALGAIPLYGLAAMKLRTREDERRKTEDGGRRTTDGRSSRVLALALALAYLLAPPLQSAVLTEFHAIPLAIPLILWAFWSVESRRWGQFVVAALLVSAVKEEAALLGAGLGLWALWRIALEWGRQDDQSPNHPILPALTVTLLSLAWFYLATFVIVPAHAVKAYNVAESSYFQRYGVLGNSPVDIFKSFFVRPALVWQIATEPARLAYVWRLLAPFGFLSLLGAEVLLLCLPVLLANLLSAYPAQYYGEFHYSAPLLPYFAVAAAYGTARLWRLVVHWTRRRSGSFQHAPTASVPAMAFVSLITNPRTALRPLAAGGLALWLLAWAVVGYAEFGRGPLGGRYDPTPIGDHERLLSRFVAQIPADAPLTATAAVHPHVSHRRYIYQFPWGLEADVPARWALIDVTGDTDMAPGDLKATVDAMLAGDWGVVDGADGYLLLRRGAAEKTIPGAFYDFARGRERKTGRQGDKETRREGEGGRQKVKSKGQKGTGGQGQKAWDTSHFTFHAPRSSPSFGPLTFLGLEYVDWPLWRRTKITTIWRVEESFTPGSVRPWMEVRQPDGTPVYTYADITPAALLWYPPERWQPGEIVRMETLWLFLPRHWGVAVGVAPGPNPSASSGRLPVLNPGGNLPLDESRTLALVDAFTRRADGTLARLPLTGEDAATFLAQAQRALGEPLRGSGGRFAAESGTVARVTGRLPGTSVPAGQWADLWLFWEIEDGVRFQRYTPFVHLRRDDGNVSQQDGPPRYFLLPLRRDAASSPDWRQLALPADLPPGRYRVVIGLFDPNTGERLAAFDADGRSTGNELNLGSIEVRSSLVPDQTCALIPPACLSQVKD